MNRPILIFIAILLIPAGCAGTMPELGVDNGKLKPCPQSPNCVNSQATDKKHFIEPITLTATSLEAKNRIVKAVNALKRSKIAVLEDHYIRAEFTSMLFRFVDDVEFYFPDQGTKELLVHVRSASRVGYSDLGVNRKRIEQIRGKLEAVK